jgi:lysine/ornithine N-monooxygenase
MENKVNLSKKYDLVFVGGGPSTISFLSYLFRNKLNDRIFPYTNILIIEKSDSFGSGCLGKYGINTNTSAEGFVRLMCNAEEPTKKGGLALSPNSKPMKTSKNYNIKEDKKLNTKTHDSGNQIYSNRNNSEKNDVEIKDFTIEKGSKINNYKPLSIFQEFFKSSPTQTLLQIGNRPAPLSLVGFFLECLGNYMLSLISSMYKKCILQSNTEVKAIKLLKTDEFSISLSNSNTSYNIKTKALILATGGRQKLSNKTTQEIKSLIGYKNFFLSDHVLQEQGFKSLTYTLFSKVKKRVIIIGGSHSGFSCSWMLLNQPSNYKNILIDDIHPEYQAKFNKECPNCSESFCCFGKVKDKNWDITQDDKAQFQFINSEVEILILYKDHIKVHYSSEQDAINDNYTVYEKKNAVNKNGNVYPFIGLRGDAKELYRNVTKGLEKRIKLVKTETWEDQKKIILQEECVVIWACGYETQVIPITDSKGNTMEFNLTDDGGMFEVDKELRIVDKNKNFIKNFYGIGQGYATFSIEMVGGKKARADAINLYNTYVSKKLHKSLMGFFSKLYIDHNEKKRVNNLSSKEKGTKIMTFEMTSGKHQHKSDKEENDKKNDLTKQLSMNNNNIIKVNNTLENQGSNYKSKVKFIKMKTLELNKENVNSPEFTEKMKLSHGLTNRKFDLKINFNKIDVEMDGIKQDKFNLINHDKKFTFKEKKQNDENQKSIKK